MDDGSIDPYQPNTACMAHDPRRCRTVVWMAPAAAHKGKTALNSHQLKGGNVKNAVDSTADAENRMYYMYVHCAVVVSP